VHGLFENPHVLRSVLDYDGTSLDQVFDGLADFLEQHMARSLLDGLIE
jgi:adenosylcobyric acid synthase